MNIVFRLILQAASPNAMKMILSNISWLFSAFDKNYELKSWNHLTNNMIKNAPNGKLAENNNLILQ